ncbi:MAG: ribosome biogenesis GTP-binding protein YihA/YsxC [Schleiferiaceae bacterium]|nr:ribosome biogenesis GTP-binding protein YihA/YsxC [Schleiferiaceae bacterium]
MIAINAVFECSSPNLKTCPPPTLPEYAFIGRSNVGKSSLINMLANKKDLAKTSSKPGKTQLINHFQVDESWYLVDLPGYGYAKVSKKKRVEFQKFISDYLKKRDALLLTFVLIDSRIEPQKIDLEFMQWLGEAQIPFSIVFTKVDKISGSEWTKNLSQYKKRLLEDWEELPQIFVSSAQTKMGREELLTQIQDLNTEWGPQLHEKLKQLKIERDKKNASN